VPSGVFVGAEYWHDVGVDDQNREVVGELSNDGVVRLEPSSSHAERAVNIDTTRKEHRPNATSIFIASNTLSTAGLKHSDVVLTYVEAKVDKGHEEPLQELWRILGLKNKKSVDIARKS
jgi:hypothetical protein